MCSPEVRRGLIVGKNGNTIPGFNNALTPCPPLNIADEDLVFMAGTLKESFEQPVRPPVA